MLLGMSIILRVVIRVLAHLSGVVLVLDVDNFLAEFVALVSFELQILLILIGMLLIGLLPRALLPNSLSNSFRTSLICLLHLLPPVLLTIQLNVL